MTIVEQVVRLLRRLTPDAVCDECIKTSLSLSRRQQANRASRMLAQRDGYERVLGRCAWCGVGRQVIRYV